MLRSRSFDEWGCEFRISFRGGDVVKFWLEGLLVFVCWTTR